MAQFRKDTHQFLKDGTTIFEVNMLSDEKGNIINGANPTGMAVDAFGRARSSQPFTLFDSFHRYQDNGKISEEAVGGSSAHNLNAGLIECTIDGNSGSYIYRESTRAFAYQPGKSLQILQTYVFSPHKTGLRQRYGYFNTQNGIFLERTDAGLCWVERSTSTGTLTETRVYQSNWNYDKLDGTGVSQLTLDMTKAQIQFIDIEWLGLGSVRCGFVINGEFVLAHTFHHANIITSTYMATACLPVRAEIENVSATGSSSTLKIVCSTVISEGGYELRGRKRTAYTPVTSQYSLATAGTYYPAASIRLNANGYLDAVAILKGMTLVGVTNGFYHYKIVSGGTITGGTWSNSATLPVVQYNINATSWSSNGTGVELQSGFISTSTQASSTLDLNNELFDFQLERNSFANTTTPLTLLVSSSVNTSNVYVAVDWQEIT